MHLYLAHTLSGMDIYQQILRNGSFLKQDPFLLQSNLQDMNVHLHNMDYCMGFHMMLYK